MTPSPYFRKLLLRLVPENRAGDRFYAWLTFILVHHRFPSTQPHLNDWLYQLRASGALGDQLRVTTSDKELVKEYIRNVVGDIHNVPTIRVLHSHNEVAASAFPSDCCIKPTHASGQVLFRRGDEALDLATIRSWFTLDYYAEKREANYRGLVPKVIVEPILFGSDANHDYKVFCSHGTPTLIQVDADRRQDHRRGFFTADWQEMPFSIKYPRLRSRIERPANLDAMLYAAARLAAPFEFVRVDFYTDGVNFYVGELTHCHEGGHGPFIPRSAEFDYSHLFFALRATK